MNDDLDDELPVVFDRDEWGGADWIPVALPDGTRGWVKVPVLERVLAQFRARSVIWFTRAQWGSAYDSFYRGATRIGPVDRLVIHHTATSQPSSAGAAPGMVRNLEAGGGSGRHIEYHALIDQYGQVFEGFDVRSQGAHCNEVPPGQSKSFNSTSLGLSLIMYAYPPYNHVPTDAMLDAAARWVADRVLVGDLSAAVLDHATSPQSTGWRGHRETGAATACPGTLLDDGHLARMMDEARRLTTGQDDDMTPAQEATLNAIYGVLINAVPPMNNGNPNEIISPVWAALWANQHLVDDVIPRLTAIEAKLGL